MHWTAPSLDGSREPVRLCERTGRCECLPRWPHDDRHRCATRNGTEGIELSVRGTELTSPVTGPASADLVAAGDEEAGSRRSRENLTAADPGVVTPPTGRWHSLATFGIGPLLVAGDLLAVAVGVVGTEAVGQSIGVDSPARKIAAFGLFLLGLLWTAGLYRSRLSLSVLDDLPTLVGRWLAAVGARRARPDPLVQGRLAGLRDRLAVHVGCGHRWGVRHRLPGARLPGRAAAADAGRGRPSDADPRCRPGRPPRRGDPPCAPGVRAASHRLRRCRPADRPRHRRAARPRRHRRS